MIVGEVDPICALQAAMDGFQVATLESVIGDVDIVVTGTGNKDVVTVEHLLGLKHLAIVANVGHFDNEIDMAGPRRARRRRARSRSSRRCTSGACRTDAACSCSARGA